MSRLLKNTWVAPEDGKTLLAGLWNGPESRPLDRARRVYCLDRCSFSRRAATDTCVPLLELQERPETQAVESIESGASRHDKAQIQESRFKIQESRKRT